MNFFCHFGKLTVATIQLASGHGTYAVIDLPLLLIAGVRFAPNNKIEVFPDRIDLSSKNLKPPFEEDRVKRDRDNELRMKENVKHNYWDEFCKENIWKDR